MRETKIDKAEDAAKAVGISELTTKELNQDKLGRIETLLESVRDDLLSGKMSIDEFRKGLDKAPAQYKEAFVKAAGSNFNIETASVAEVTNLVDKWARSLGQSDVAGLCSEEKISCSLMDHARSQVASPQSGKHVPSGEEMAGHMRDAAVVLLGFFTGNVGK